MGILWLLVVGLVAGLIARALVPGRQSMGLLMTMVLGVVGSF
ncbi:MAG TPA: GlsB/YeaQ/YmgE family stress response membrane protein, partial [Archangium sp.]|nr:GlsB/YeaQ/YmgE family stress response membrane protein [Archangium sp.]